MACVGGGKAVGEILECKSYAQFDLTLVARRLANRRGLMALVARDTVGVIGKV